MLNEILLFILLFRNLTVYKFYVPFYGHDKKITESFSRVKNVTSFEKQMHPVLLTLKKSVIK